MLAAKTSPVAKAPAPERLSRAARRRQLLDAAAEMITQRGVDGVTMEGVAAIAGVSKALPYLHFDNAEALIMTLREREMDELGFKVAEAVQKVEGFESKIATAVHVLFELLKVKGDLLLALVWGPDTNFRLRTVPQPRLSKTDWFLAGLFESEFHLKKTDARIAQRMLSTGLVGAYEAFVEGIAGQRATERAAVRLIVDGTRALGQAKS